MSTQGDKPPRSSLLPSERAALGQPSLTTGGLAEDGGTSLADDDGLGVREDGGDGEAAGALDVHEEGSRGGDEGLASSVRSIVETCEIFCCLSYLELVLLGLAGRGRVQKINGENLGGGESAKLFHHRVCSPRLSIASSS